MANNASTTRYNMVSRCLAGLALMFVYVFSTSVVLVGASTTEAQAQRGRGGGGRGGGMRGGGMRGGGGRGRGGGYRGGGRGIGFVGPAIGLGLGVLGAGCHYSYRWGRYVCY